MAILGAILHTGLPAQFLHWLLVDSYSAVLKCPKNIVTYIKYFFLVWVGNGFSSFGPSHVVEGILDNLICILLRIFTSIFTHIH